VTELKQFKLPDVGEGLTEADIVKWHVQQGDQVTVNQTIVEIETAKAVVELPCPFDGVVAGLLVAEGQTVAVGTPIISVEQAGDADPADAAADLPARRAPADGSGRAGAPAPPQARQPVLVGYGVKLGTTARRPRKAAAGTGPTAAGAAPAQSGQTAGPAGSAAGSAVDTTPPTEVAGRVGRVTVLAKPPVRKLARELGVDLAVVTGTGPSGSITRADVQGAAQAAAHVGTGAAADVGTRLAAVPAALGMTGPREERIPIRGVRKHTAAAVAASAFTAPHVTEFLQVDATETMAAVDRLRDLPEFADVRVSPLLFAAKALLAAVARHPMINSSWDEQAAEIVVKRYVNLGIAAATDRGLVVPNIKDAHTLPMLALADALNALARTARAGKSTLADLQGGTITITNVGILGVDSGTPILTPGEAAILAVGQIRDMPWVRDGALAVRKVCTLALSFDHRIVDGDLGSAVLRDVGAMIEDPVRMLAWT
jgi:pyruvate dehydrogenase E2 component (dihydrolipoamide acetyltransferase)